MTLRGRIEKSKNEGTRIRTDTDYAEKSYKTEKERLAREKAQLEAKEILEGLPNRVMEAAEQGQRTTLVVCSIDSINTLDELRRAFEHRGCYVLKALEAEDYKLDVSIDCSGNWSTNNSLMCQF